MLTLNYHPAYKSGGTVTEQTLSYWTITKVIPHKVVGLAVRAYNSNFCGVLFEMIFIAVSFIIGAKKWKGMGCVNMERSV